MIPRRNDDLPFLAIMTALFLFAAVLNGVVAVMHPDFIRGMLAATELVAARLAWELVKEGR